MKRALRQLLSVFLVAAASFFTTEISAQYAVVDWNITPPNSNEGYALGETIEICIDVDSVYLSALNWLHGFSFTFSEQFNQSTIIPSYSAIQCGPFSGEWDWYNSVTSVASGLTYGPGYFFETATGSGNAGSDNSPGNNWGQPCPSSTDYSMCFQIDLIENCWPDDIFVGSDLSISLEITGDGNSGNWIFFSENTFTSQAPGAMLFNCCDAYSGKSPYTIPTTCEIGIGCLMDIITDELPVDTGGIWIGPNGWTSTDYCGEFNGTIDPAGIYTYTVLGTNDCPSSTSILIEDTHYWAGELSYCSETPIGLSDFVQLAEEGYPLSGVWYLPRENENSTWVEVPEASIASGVSPIGIYTYIFEDENGCTHYLESDIVLGYPSYEGGEINLEFCLFEPTICLADLLPESIAIGGQWILYNADDEFLQFYATFDYCATTSDFPNAGKLTYVQGTSPCMPIFTDFNFDFGTAVNAGADISLTICIEDTPIQLETLLPEGAFGQVTPGLIWTDLTEDPSLPTLTFPFDPSIYPPFTTLELAYSGQSQSPNCFNTALVTVYILPEELAESELEEISICQNQSPFDLADSFPNSLTPGGHWTNQDGELVDEIYSPGLSNPDVYTYTVATNCDTSISTLNITEFVPNISDATLDFCDSQGTVDLNQFLAGVIESGGQWTYPNENNGDAILDLEAAEDGNYIYTVSPNACTDSASYFIRIESFESAGPDQELHLCATGESTILMTYLPEESSNLGYFDTESILALPDFNATYTYIIDREICDSDTSSHVLDFNPIPSVVDMAIQCNEADPNYYFVQALIGEGTPPFASNDGGFQNDLFTSDLISVAENPNFSMAIADTYGCATTISGSIDDEEGDGLCTYVAIIGCQNPAAANYNPFATEPGLCEAGGYVDEPIEQTEQNSGGPFGGWGLAGQSGGVEHQWDFSVFPNPWQSTTKLKIAIKGLADKESIIIELYDLTGRLVWKQSMTLQNGFEIYSIPLPRTFDAGTYLFSVVTENRDRKSQVLVIAH